MSNEIGGRGIAHGLTVYALVSPISDWTQVSSSGALVTYAVADLDDYDIPMPETPENSYNYVANFPPTLNPGIYLVRTFIQAGALPDIEDEPFNAPYFYNWKGSAGSISWSGVAAGFTPAGVLADMKIVFGATAGGATDRVTVITNREKLAASYVWNYCAWGWRHVAYDIATVANQAYTALPSDFCRVADFGDWLPDTDTGDRRPVYVTPAQFKQLGAVHDDRGVNNGPQYYTFGNETIASAWTPVVRWYPTPTAVHTFTGFHYFKAMPTFDEASTDAFFPGVQWDGLWIAKTQRLCADVLTQVEVRAPTERQIRDMLEDARADYEWTPPSVQDVDAYGDTDDLACPFAASGERYDSSGKLLLG